MQPLLELLSDSSPACDLTQVRRKRLLTDSSIESTRLALVSLYPFLH
jgi:hypothetical protein